METGEKLYICPGPLWLMHHGQNWSTRGRHSQQCGQCQKQRILSFLWVTFETFYCTTVLGGSSSEAHSLVFLSNFGASHLAFPPSPFSLRERATHAFCRFGRRSLKLTACTFIIWPKEIDDPFSKLIRCFKVQRGRNQGRELPTHCKTGPKLLNSKYEQSKEAIFLLTQVFFSAQFFSFLIRSIGFFVLFYNFMGVHFRFLKRHWTFKLLDSLKAGELLSWGCFITGYQHGTLGNNKGCVTI